MDAPIGAFSVTKKAAWVLIWALIFGALDILTTYVVLDSGGREINPVPAMMMEYFGVDFTLFVINPILKILFSLILLACVAYAEKRYSSTDWSVRFMYGGCYFYLIFQILIVISNEIQILGPF